MRDPARTEREALRRYKSVLQRSLGVITKAIWIAGEQDRTQDRWFLALSEDPLRLVKDDGGYVYLRAAQSFTYEKHGTFIGEWKVKTLGYAYTIGVGPADEDAIVAWHWHPAIRDECHAHVYWDHPIVGALARWHLPSRRISFEEIIRFLIADLGVRARLGWEGVLDDSQARFDQFKSWQ